MRGLLVVTPDVKKSWIKHHLVGESLAKKPISQRGRDWFWRVAVLTKKSDCPADVLQNFNVIRKQLKREFSENLDSGKLKEFIRSLDEALGKPVNRHDVESKVSDFLIRGWIHHDSPFCCFNYEALAGLLTYVFEKDYNSNYLGKLCRKLKLKPVHNPPVGVVIETKNLRVFKVGFDAI